jgi:putative alpha-1,2-mannosidase
VAGFAVTSPSFPHASIRLGNGALLQIDAPGAADGKFYIQELRINGQMYRSPWIPWSLVSNGAQIEFVLGDSPNQAWGVQSDVAPPSFDSPGGL